LTFRSEVTGSGVVVDEDLGEGVNFVGIKPILRAAVSLKQRIFFYIEQILIETNG
jgi:hypothetical protein